MSLFHGTSAGAALKMLSPEGIVPSRDGFLYCFDSEKPESMAGAICFATGGDLRNGVIDTKDFFGDYCDLNPDYPRGLKGAFVTVMLKKAIRDWTADQRELAVPPYEDRAAILVYQSHSDAIHVNRGGIINEVTVPAAAFASLVLEKAYFDDALLASPEVVQLKKNGVVIEPLSAWAAQVHKQAADAKNAPKPKKNRGGPGLA